MIIEFTSAACLPTGDHDHTLNTALVLASSHRTLRFGEDNSLQHDVAARVRFDLSCNIHYPAIVLTPEPSPALEGRESFSDLSYGPSCDAETETAGSTDVSSPSRDHPSTFTSSHSPTLSSSPSPGSSSPAYPSSPQTPYTPLSPFTFKRRSSRLTSTPTDRKGEASGYSTPPKPIERRIPGCSDLFLPTRRRLYSSHSSRMLDGGSMPVIEDLAILRPADPRDNFIAQVDHAQTYRQERNTFQQYGEMVGRAEIDKESLVPRKHRTFKALFGRLRRKTA